MTTRDQSPPPEEPEAEGIPDPAADTSTAYDQVDRPRFDDSPPALPADQPQAVEEFGVTALEGRRGEPLSDRLTREQPDITAEDRPPRPESAIEEEVETEDTAAQAARDAEVIEDGPEPEAGPASAYDRPDSGREIGRLAEPDQQSLVDTEKDEVARDQGEAGGGATAEEAAMHEVDQDEVPYE